MPRPRPRRSLFDDPYWAYVADGQLRLQQCSECQAFRYPPGPVCPECLSESSAWVPLSGQGRLLSWTVFHRQYFPSMPPPYVVAAIRTVEGPILIGNLVDVESAVLELDMPVSAIFHDVPDPAGDWRICLWQPKSVPSNTATRDCRSSS